MESKTKLKVSHVGIASLSILLYFYNPHNLLSPTCLSSPTLYLFQVTFKGWNGVATWKWVANDDTCGICRVAFDGCCPDCKLPGDDCPLVWGQGRKRL